MVNDRNKCNQCNKHCLNHSNEYHLIREQDFYPHSDNRCWKSNVRDIAGGDNFADFCEYFFEVLDEEEYFDN